MWQHIWYLEMRILFHILRHPMGVVVGFNLIVGKAIIERGIFPVIQ